MSEAIQPTFDERLSLIALPQKPIALFGTLVQGDDRLGVGLLKDKFTEVGQLGGSGFLLLLVVHAPEFESAGPLTPVSQTGPVIERRSAFHPASQLSPDDVFGESVGDRTLAGVGQIGGHVRQEDDRRGAQRATAKATRSSTVGEATPASTARMSAEVIRWPRP